MRTRQHKYLPIPVVDLHGYQMIYHGLGVLWETSYINTLRTRKESFSCMAANINRKLIHRYSIFLVTCSSIVSHTLRLACFSIYIA